MLNVQQLQDEAAKLSWLGASTIVAQLSLVASMFFLGSELSQADFGLFTFCLTVQAYFLTLGSGGIGMVVMRAGLRRAELCDAAVTSYFVVTLVRSLAFALLATIVVIQLPLPSEEAFLLIVFFWGSVVGGINGQSLLDMRHRQAASAVVGTVGEVAATAMLAYLWQSGGLNLSWAGGVFVGKWIATSAARLLLFHLAVQPFHFHFSAAIIREVWAKSWPLAASSLVSAAPFSAGVILLWMLSGPNEAAILGLSQSVVKGLQQLCSLSHRLLQPRIVGPEGLTATSRAKVWLFAVAFHLAILAIGLAGSTIAVGWMFGPQYADVIPMLWLLLPSAAVASLATIGQMYLVAWEKEFDAMWISIVTSGVYLLGCLAVVPYFTVFGAAIMTGVATLLRVAYTWRQLRQASGEVQPPLASRVFRLATICCIPFWLIQSICERLVRRRQSEERHVLLLVTNQLTAHYVRRATSALNGDNRIKLFLARAPLADRRLPLSAILEGGQEQPISFLVALWRRWDLVITAEHYPAGLFHPRTKITFVSHGVYSGKKIDDEDYIYGHRCLRFWGSPLYHFMFATGAIEEECARREHSQLANRIAVVGDPVLDDLRDTELDRIIVRREMQLESKRVILVMSSWGEHSLIQRHGKALLNELKAIDQKSTEWILSLHPNNFTRGSSIEKTKALVAALQSQGVHVLSAGEDWRPHLAAADLAISDFTSLSIYFAQLGRPLIYFDRYDDLVVAGGPLHRLLQLCPNRRDFSSLAEAIEHATAQYPREIVNRLNRQIALPWGADQHIRDALYGSLHLTPPFVASHSRTAAA